MALLITKSGGRKVKYERYDDYKIILEQVDRDWSEDAWQYKIEGTDFKDECEGYNIAVSDAKQIIDKINS